jgi:hypothetical protein
MFTRGHAERQTSGARRRIEGASNASRPAMMNLMNRRFHAKPKGLRCPRSSIGVDGRCMHRMCAAAQYFLTLPASSRPQATQSTMARILQTPWGMHARRPHRRCAPPSTR